MSESSNARDASLSAQRYARGEKTAERVARSILETIAADSLKPGDSLPTEVEMLREKGVGRATLREALRILEVNGLIMIRPGPGGGPIVTASSARDFGRVATMHFQRAGLTFKDLLDARLTLEPLLARMAAERTDRKGFSALADARQQGQETDPDDHKAYAAVTRHFHRVLSQASGNPLLDFLTNTLADVYFDRFGLNLYESPDDRRKVLAIHEAIAAAVIAGDGDVAERLTREHMQAFAASGETRMPGLMREIINWS
jgi:GntR family transcriptional repressor for pyruvate dehydrogenase complex